MSNLSSPGAQMVLGCPYTEQQQSWHSPCIVFTPDNNYAISNEQAKSISIWDANTSQMIGSLVDPRERSIVSLAVSPDGRRLVTMSDDNSVRIWDLRTRSIIHTLPLGINRSFVRCVAISPNGCRFLHTYHVNMRLADLDTGTILFDLYAESAGHSIALMFAWCPDNEAIAVVSVSGVVVLKATDGTLVSRFSAAPRSSCAMFSPDGQAIICGDVEGDITIYSAADGRLLQNLQVELHDDQITALVGSPDGTRFASASSSAVVVWDARVYAVIAVPVTDLTRNIGHVAYGKYLAISSSNGTISIWDIDAVIEAYQKSHPVSKTQGTGRTESASVVFLAPFPSASVSYSYAPRIPRIRGPRGDSDSFLDLPETENIDIEVTDSVEAAVPRSSRTRERLHSTLWPRLRSHYPPHANNAKKSLLISLFRKSNSLNQKRTESTVNQESGEKQRAVSDSLSRLPVEDFTEVPAGRLDERLSIAPPRSKVPEHVDFNGNKDNDNNTKPNNKASLLDAESIDWLDYMRFCLSSRALNVPSSALFSLSTTVINSFERFAFYRDNMAIPDVYEALQHCVYNDLPIHLIKLTTYQNQIELRLIDRDWLIEYLTPEVESITEFDIENEIALWSTISEQWLEIPPARHREFAIHEQIRRMTRYATLSHRWVRHEPSFRDLKKNRNLFGEGYEKLKTFCNIARTSYRVQFAWADTVCIDKSSSSELDESIRSMFKWYANAAVCIAYLAETTSLFDMTADSWFTRGYWDVLTWAANDKSWEQAHSTPISILDQLEEVTRISRVDFAKFSPGVYDISKHMTWIAGRKTTRGEDKAYSLMGIFGVSFSIAYGEGPEHAFCRLLRAIIDISPNLDIFNWAGHPINRNFHPSRMLPSSPECYLKRFKVQRQYLPFEPPMLTSDGIRLKLLVVPVTSVHVETIGNHCGDVYAFASFKCVLANERLNVILLECDALTLEHLRIPRGEGAGIGSRPRLALAIWNVDRDLRSIPIVCLAIVLNWKNGWQRVTITDPITFISRDEFSQQAVTQEMEQMYHMQLTTMCL
ncbi:hypothetical protein BJ138DRAFT_1117597 [Hygrophoropsis aurantiaca]|uniref:Uncharacterized protein n=1 Tax=Hygrophoropsis aurantiaca TaxID=72124 RepID=A0ACB8A093_9AGAM|nr:hypothetical protein BJ138DRAFT_1117597 [Hygrophoropsis aurantiaca]